MAGVEKVLRLIEPEHPAKADPRSPRLRDRQTSWARRKAAISSLLRTSNTSPTSTG